MKFIAAARAHAKPNRIDLTDNRKLGCGTWHLEKTNLLQGVCLYTPLSLSCALLLSLSLSLYPPLFSLHCLGWQLLDCFTSRSPRRWLLRGKTQTHNLFLLTAIHCMFVSGCPCGQYCLDERLKCESRGEDTTGQDKAWISTWLSEIGQTISSVPWEQNKIQCNVNILIKNWQNLRE